MMHQATFIVVGRVARKYHGERSSNLTLTVEMEDRSPRVDMVAFDDRVRDLIRGMDDKAEVKVAGRIGSTTVKARGGKPVIIDGYEKWVPQLVIDEVLEVAKPWSAPPEQENPPPPGSDDDIPF